MLEIPHTLPKFLWFFARRYRLYLMGMICVIIYWSTYTSLITYMMKLIIDRVAAVEDPNQLYAAVTLPVLLYIGLNFFLGLFFRFYEYMMLKIFPDMKIKIIEEMFKYVEKHSYSYFQNHFSGSLANKINDMARSSSLIMFYLIEQFFARLLTLAIGCFTMFLVHPSFAMVLVIWSVIFLGGSILLSRKAEHYAEVYSEARSVAVGKVVDSLGNILNVKLFARERYEASYLRTYLEDGAEKNRQNLWYLLKVKAFYSITITCLSAAMIWLLVYERSRHAVSVGDFALVLTLTLFLIEEMFVLVNQLVPFSEEVGTCKQALHVISEKHEMIDVPEAKELHISCGEIVFDKVHFQYKKGQSVFVDKSVTIRAGEKVGLVGFSGSGKSTFVNLILRFFDVDSGRILIDGQDIKEVTQESLRSQIAMIPQDPLLFHRSLMENIRYGRLGASDEEVLQASVQAHCHEYIKNLKDGYDSLVGERGVKLSGGQRQRIAIARAILKNASILILDEATSSLDSVIENAIQQSLHKLMEGKTTIVIAHRLSTLFSMDRLLVFNKGHIVEEGTHAELLELNGHYSKLWKMQAGGFIGSI